MARGRVLPTSFTAGRKITLAGTVYALGAVIPNAVVARLPHASALLSRRLIIPANEQYPNKVNNTAFRRAKPHPYSLVAKERRSLGA